MEASSNTNASQGGTAQTMLDAIILIKDISESGINVFKTDRFTVQQFSYRCGRSRTSSGIPYGPTTPSYLDFTVRVTAKEQGKVFFERAGLNKPFRYSLLFNAAFDTKGRCKLTAYEEAMVVTGYLVEMEEFFDQPVITKDASGNPVVFSEEQQLLHCRLLLCGIDFIGSENSLTLTITED